MSRRTLVVVTVLVVVPAVLVVAALAGVAFLWSQARVDTIGSVDFSRPLAIPPLAASRADAQGRKVFDLALRQGVTDLGQGEPTRTWGVNGSHLGPTIRAGRGETVLLNVTNGLDEPTTLHWHGMHLPARMDGGPHQMVAPQATWSPSWEVDQPAATLWYHPHLHGQTADHVYRGLAGMFIVDDVATSAPGLPHEYGVDDIPVMVQDKEFDGSGQLRDGGSFLSSVGALGDTLLVNGTPGPYLEVSTRVVRLRVLNASNARVYDFGLSDGRRLALVGTDGGLLPAPYWTQRVQLSPGERAEVVVAMAPGERVVLRSTPPALDGGSVQDRLTGGDDAFDVMELRAASTLTGAHSLATRLVDVPRLRVDEPTATRVFELTGTQINRREMDLTRIDEVVTLGATEAWQVTNRDGTMHSFHVHDVQFQVDSVDGVEPPPQLRGWKDTVFLPPGRRMRLVVRFTDYADAAAPYMFHCHLLRHEDQGMMGQLVVVRPGEKAATRLPEPGLDPRSHRGSVPHAGH